MESMSHEALQEGLVLWCPWMATKEHSGEEDAWPGFDVLYIDRDTLQVCRHPDCTMSVV